MRARPLATGLRRLLVLAGVLAVVGVVVPDAGTPAFDGTLVRADTAHAVDTRNGVIWILALGSDARPGEPTLRSRSDAIHLVGINPHTGAATMIGIPRDSYVDIPGYGRNKINAAMVFGGPQLTARAVTQMVGIRPDYVFVTDFFGFAHMVRSLGGFDVYSKYAFDDPRKNFKHGFNHVNGFEALAFARVRHALPHGDFDRSHDQGALLVAGLRKARQRAELPGGFEQAVYSFLRNTKVDLPPGDLYRLARAVLEVKPSKVSNCVIQGGTGYAGAQSVVFPNLTQAHRIAARARHDATLHGGC